jgi:hypothetical protein
MKQDKTSQNARRRRNNLLCKFLKYYTTWNNATMQQEKKMENVQNNHDGICSFFLACMCISLNSSSPFKKKLMSFWKKSKIWKNHFNAIMSSKLIAKKWKHEKKNGHSLKIDSTKEWFVRKKQRQPPNIPDHIWNCLRFNTNPSKIYTRSTIRRIIQHLSYTSSSFSCHWNYGAKPSYYLMLGPLFWKCTHPKTQPYT